MADENGAATTTGFACEPCKQKFSSEVFLKLHLKSEQHMINIGEDPEKIRLKGLQEFTKVPTGPVVGNPTIEMLRWISQAKVSLIGLDFIYEVQRYRGKGFCYYVCTVCRENFFQVFTHLLSLKHFTKFMIQQQNELEGVIQSSKFSDLEKQCMENIISMSNKPADEMFRVLQTKYSVDPERVRIIVRFLCGAINLKRGRKRCNAVVELEGSGFKSPRQLTLAEQVAMSDLSGRIDERNYPEDLLLKVWETYGNFSRFATKGEMEEYHGGYDEGPGPGPMYPPEPYWDEEPYPHHGPPGPRQPPFCMGEVRPLMSMPVPMGGCEQEEPPLRMGAALAGWKMEKAAAKQPISLLEWLHKSVQKLDMEVLTVRGVEPAKAIIELLQCGIDMFKGNPGIKRVCNYTNPIEPDKVPLDEWLEITAKFLENGWLCSDREVRMSTVLVQQIQIALDRYLEVPANMSYAGQYGDPYNGLSHSDDGNMAMEWQQQQLPGRRNPRGKPYARSQPPMPPQGRRGRQKGW